MLQNIALLLLLEARHVIINNACTTAQNICNNKKENRWKVTTSTSLWFSLKKKDFPLFFCLRCFWYQWPLPCIIYIVKHPESKHPTHDSECLTFIEGREYKHLQRTFSSRSVKYAACLSARIFIPVHRAVFAFIVTCFNLDHFYIWGNRYCKIHGGDFALLTAYSFHIKLRFKVWSSGRSKEHVRSNWFKIVSLSLWHGINKNFSFYFIFFCVHS